jgi:hypothetical protein
VIILRTPFPSEAARHDGLVSVIPSILVLAVAALVLLPRCRHAASLLLVAAVIAEMWPLTIGWNSPFPVSTFYPRTPLIDAVLRHHRPGLDRVAGIGGVLFPNTNAMFGIEDARIHDPMEPTRFVHSIDKVISHDYYKKWLDESTPLLDRLNVRWLMTEPEHGLKDGSRYVLRYAGADGRLYENLHVLPRFFAADADVRIVSASGDAYTLEVDAARPTTVMSSVGWSKWWKLSFRDSGSMKSEHYPPMSSQPYPIEPPSPRAKTRGEGDTKRSGVRVRGVTTRAPSSAFGTFSPAKSAGEKDSRLPESVESLRISQIADQRSGMQHDPFLSFPIPAGRTTVRIRYVPVSFYIAALISLLTAAILVCFMIRARVQRHLDLRRRALRDRDRLRPALEPDGP